MGQTLQIEVTINIGIEQKSEKRVSDIIMYNHVTTKKNVM